MRMRAKESGTSISTTWTRWSSCSERSMVFYSSNLLIHFSREWNGCWILQFESQSHSSRYRDWYDDSSIHSSSRISCSSCSIHWVFVTMDIDNDVGDLPCRAFISEELTTKACIFLYISYLGHKGQATHLQAHWCLYRKSPCRGNRRWIYAQEHQ